MKLAIVLLGVPLALAGCGPSATTGSDRASGSQATTVTWSDGQPAYAISCSVPGGCQQRALAMCNGKYTTLKSENMPVPGNVYYQQGAPSVVVRCG
jgi:hypothetical protein